MFFYVLVKKNDMGKCHRFFSHGIPSRIPRLRKGLDPLSNALTKCVPKMRGTKILAKILAFFFSLIIFGGFPGTEIEAKTRVRSLWVDQKNLIATLFKPWFTEPEKKHSRNKVKIDFQGTGVRILGDEKVPQKKKSTKNSPPNLVHWC